MQAPGRADHADAIGVHRGLVGAGRRGEPVVLAVLVGVVDRRGDSGVLGRAVGRRILGLPIGEVAVVEIRRPGQGHLHRALHESRSDPGSPGHLKHDRLEVVGQAGRARRDRVLILGVVDPAGDGRPRAAVGQAGPGPLAAALDLLGRRDAGARGVARPGCVATGALDGFGQRVAGVLVDVEPVGEVVGARVGRAQRGVPVLGVPRGGQGGERIRDHTAVMSINTDMISITVTRANPRSERRVPTASLTARRSRRHAQRAPGGVRRPARLGGLQSVDVGLERDHLGHLGLGGTGQGPGGDVEVHPDHVDIAGRPAGHLAGLIAGQVGQVLDGVVLEERAGRLDVFGQHAGAGRRTGPVARRRARRVGRRALRIDFGLGQRAVDHGQGDLFRTTATFLAVSTLAKNTAWVASVPRMKLEASVG